MTRFKDNLLLQFSVMAVVTMIVLGAIISVVLEQELYETLSLLEVHGAAMMAGDMIKDTDPFSIPSLTRDVHNLQWITYGLVVGGLAILYVGLVGIVWRGWRTIREQQSQLATANVQLEELYVVKTSGTKGEPLKRATWTLTGSGSSQICQPPFS